MNLDLDGVTTRPVRTEDLERFSRMWTRLSPDTRYRRFHAPVLRLSEKEARRLVEVDHNLREAIVAVVDDEVVGCEIVGIARYDRSPTEPGTATFAVMIEDAWQGRGVGRRLLVELTALADSHGVDTFTAEVQADNRRMLRLIDQLFPGSRSRISWGVQEIRGHLPHRSPHVPTVSAVRPRTRLAGLTGAGAPGTAPAYGHTGLDQERRDSPTSAARATLRHIANRGSVECSCGRTA